MWGRNTARRGRAMGAALVVAAVAGLGAPAGASATPNYVALGDSFAAGPLIPVPVPPYGCLKSSSNYANLVALRVALELRDRTCSGASTKHMYEEHGVFPGPANPPQLEALDGDTRLVTLQIGGNDMGFGGLALDCASLQPTGSFCRAEYVVDGVDRVSARIATAGERVSGVLQAIRARAPRARVLVVNYAAIFPHAGGGCWPLLPIASGDVPWLRAKHEELNAMLAAQAAAHGAVLVDAYAASRGKDACSLPAIRWTEPAVPFVLGAPVHPSLTGMLGMADMVAARAGAPAGTLDSTLRATTSLVRSLLPR